jgi:serine/threonine-protein kinase RsbT
MTHSLFLSAGSPSSTRGAVGSEIESLAQLLERSLSPVNARALVLRALRENGLSTTAPTRTDLRKCMGTLRRGLELFLPPGSRDSALHDLKQFCGEESQPPIARSLSITTESDVAKARAEARRVCEQAGTSGFAMQKITTIVSELARNIVLYAQRGTIDIVPDAANPRRIVVRASDQGPGIAHLDKILSGQYESKTGLGRGLSGTKRLADRFDISTGSAGTNIVVLVVG